MLINEGMKEAAGVLNQHVVEYPQAADDVVTPIQRLERCTQRSGAHTTLGTIYPETTLSSNGGLHDSLRLRRHMCAGIRSDDGKLQCPSHLTGGGHSTKHAAVSVDTLGHFQRQVD
jgi:hypothetical protein